MAKIIQILSVFILITQFKYANKSFVSYVIISYIGTEVHNNYYDVVLIAIVFVIIGRTDFSLLFFLIIMWLIYLYYCHSSVSCIEASRYIFIADGCPFKV